MEHLKEGGFALEVKDVKNISEIKTRLKIPENLQSCHTAIVDGYILEGHVPIAEVLRMLKERPDIAGLSVPGMPIGSPGMEMEHEPAEAYRVIAFDSQGRTGVYATYPKK